MSEPRVADWVGRERVTRDVLSVERARLLAATLDLEPAGLREGAPLPPGWHWIYFHDAVPRSELAADGHETRGGFLPPVPLPRRMWAGGRLRFDRPLRMGDDVRRVSTVRAVEEKEGRAGPLAFVTVEHVLSDDAGPALIEEQDIVYVGRPGPGGARSPGGREVRAAGSAAHAEVDATPDDGWTSTFVADEVTLFRFSALTFNGHRIHYDRPWATDVEGYPGLVVHGPLLALLLLGAGARWALPGEAGGAGAEPGFVGRFAYRSLQPLFCGESITLRGRRGPEAAGGSTLQLGAEHAARGTVVRAELTTRPDPTERSG